MHHLDLRGYLFAGIFVFGWTLDQLKLQTFTTEFVQNNFCIRNQLKHETHPLVAFSSPKDHLGKPIIYIRFHFSLFP